MKLDNLIIENEKTIRKLAEKNNVDFDMMKENWKDKLKEFDTVTDEAGIVSDVETILSESDDAFVALTVNGSLIIASKPDENGIRKIRYQSIKIRNDESKDIPADFDAKLKKEFKLKESIVFEETMETSPIIAVKKTDKITDENFEDHAENITLEITKKFKNLDDIMLTKKIAV